MPGGLYQRMMFHFAEYQAQAIRNDEFWGRIHTAADRPVFRFLDFERRAVRWGDDLQSPEVNSARILSIIDALVFFAQNLPSGQAIAIDHTAPPRPGRLIGSAIVYLNRELTKLGSHFQVGYTDYLRSLLTDLIISEKQSVADYYLNFPVLDGVSILVKA